MYFFDFKIFKTKNHHFQKNTNILRHKKSKLIHKETCIITPKVSNFEYLCSLYTSLFAL